MKRFRWSHFGRAYSFVPVLGLGLACVANAGCSSLDGLRSVAANRPSLTGLWDRSPAGLDEPANDLYARTMNSGSKPAPGADASAVSVQPEDELAVQLVEPGDVERNPGTITEERRQPPSNEVALVAIPRPGRGRGEGQAVDQAAATQAPEVIQAHSTPSRNAANATQLLRDAEAHLKSLTTYQVKMKRTERVRGRLQPEEEIVMSIRREPKAVRFAWEDGPNQGREVIYSKALDPRTLFVHITNTAVPLPTMKISVDSPMVTSNSRHSITEAGLDRVIENLRRSSETADAAESGPKDLVYHGMECPPGSEVRAHHFTHRTLSKETWTVYLEPKTLMPLLVEANDPAGELVERYRYGQLKENPADLAAADAFVPDARWGQSKGLLSRLVGSSASHADGGHTADQAN